LRDLSVTFSSQITNYEVTNGETFKSRSAASISSMYKIREPFTIFTMLGDVAGKRFHLLRHMSRSCNVLKRQKISIRYLLHKTAPDMC